MDEKRGTSVWIPADVRDRADEIVAFLQVQPGQYGAVTRSSVLRAALDRFYHQLGLGAERDPR